MRTTSPQRTQIQARLHPVQSALESKRELEVHVEQPIPVILAYTTAVARFDGTIHFFEDIYRHDQRLERALRSR
ncbi:MAG: hypothetical protein HY791_25790 [Deltaproteobacteria bacterium]|nr:hypothetical protein [Deltaproteobacteria bacterium]